LKRRSRAIEAFSNDSSLLRLVESILMDSNKEWITGQRYLSGSQMIMSGYSGGIYNSLGTLPLF